MASLLPPYPLYISLIHFVHGLIAGYLSWDNPVASIIMFLSFTIYEIIEGIKIKDKIFYELREWAVGYTVGVVMTMGL